MTVYFVTRHAGAVEWARENGLGEAQAVEHLDPQVIVPGDVVIGTLPVHIIADITAKGARYFHLVMDLPPEMRGRDLSAGDMRRCQARLEEYRAERISNSPL